MSGIEIVGSAAAGAFVLTCSVVGLRLLWLARRTRELPELCIGAGLFSVAAVGFPLLIASGVAVTAIGGVVASAMMYLTFISPAAYRAWVLRRAVSA